MSVTVRWHGDKFLADLSEATNVGLQRAGAFYHTEARREVSRPNSGVRRRRSRNTRRGNKGSSYTVYPHPSKPGEPPKVRTGFGRQNVVMNWSGWKTKEPWVRVGVTKNGMYMYHLEIGTRHVKKRPWLVATLMKHQHTIAKLAMHKGKLR